ncbi:MAG: hypothetical protein O3C01_03380 [Bacteroidetes bacterium]|nr:hypothetical protein [Bacteroidota bacterium]MDA1018838.1 hypothetical protein [Bacteroidota bacterium]
MKKKLLILFAFSLSITSCISVEPNVDVKNDIHLTIDGENIDGIQGEWTIISEEKEENGKEIIIIRIEKRELE